MAIVVLNLLWKDLLFGLVIAAISKKNETSSDMTRALYKPKGLSYTAIKYAQQLCT